MTAPKRDAEQIAFTAYTAIAAEGARIGLMTCEACGATILLDPRDQTSWSARHRDWHLHLRALLESEYA